MLNLSIAFSLFFYLHVSSSKSPNSALLATLLYKIIPLILWAGHLGFRTWYGVLLLRTIIYTLWFGKPHKCSCKFLRSIYLFKCFPSICPFFMNWQLSFVSSLPAQNEILLDKFREMPWHRMSKKNKFVYYHLLMRLQSGVVLNCGPFAELNLETFSNVNWLFLMKRFEWFLNEEIFNLFFRCQKKYIHFWRRFKNSWSDSRWHLSKHFHVDKGDKMCNWSIDSPLIPSQI